jgi:hypothetical protein
VDDDQRSKYREDAAVPRLQDINPVFRSADIICGTAPPMIYDKSKIHSAETRSKVMVHAGRRGKEMP